MVKRKDPKRKVSEESEDKHFKIKCMECDHINQVPVARFYDGFEGEFLCGKCTYTLDMANHITDE